MNESLMLALLIGCCMALAGCASTTRVVQNNERCDMRLLDLRGAFDSGAMDQTQYTRARREAVGRCQGA